MLFNMTVCIILKICYIYILFIFYKSNNLKLIIEIIDNILKKII